MELSGFKYAFTGIFWFAFTLYLAYKIYRSIRIVSAQECIIVERLGRYSRTLHAGFHILIPFIDEDSYYHTLKEQAIDVPPQTCITKDNVKVEMDGILYLRVLDPQRASYGIDDYRFAVTQLVQTTMRAIIGTMDMDTTFETREVINSKILEVLDQAAEPWGVRVNRYEIVNITPPKSIIEAMEREKKAQITKKAQISLSEGDRDSRINRSLGVKEEAINKSEGEKQKRINEAEGLATEIESIAEATAKGIALLASSIKSTGGKEAVKLRIAQRFIKEIEKLGQEGTDLVLPLNLSNFKSVMKAVLGGESKA
ncbi:SPFH domain/Band 7 family protein [Leptospira broomii serovar Hurstbridge str. 5399]|uniref:SPFH domain/Band 7 family protein n=1 Tax=Leptospira broomii serovar Hurstbridge str. 5399 TaxID=1049789 RepID=T0GAA0_9LEPT|nr:stomatin-like protein [Leptospira broomii]EQA43739.1 SPFH domain/Band 7 family protein [Leptospira broomii serovar Hurstbridge str. 5399]